MSQFTFRAAGDADWHDVETLLEQRGLPTEGAREHLPGFLLAHDRAGNLGGIAGVERYGDVGLLRSVAVAEQHKGLGRVLVERVLASSKAGGVRRLALLTETAAGYFPRFGFRRISWAELPEELQASAELQGVCSSSATAMIRDL